MFKTKASVHMFRALFFLLTSPPTRTLLLSNKFVISLGLWKTASSLCYAILSSQNWRLPIPWFEKPSGVWISTRRRTYKIDFRFCRAFCRVSTALVYPNCLWRHPWSSSKSELKSSVLWELIPRVVVKNLYRNTASDAYCGERTELSGYTIAKCYVPPGHGSSKVVAERFDGLSILIELSMTS